MESPHFNLVWSGDFRPQLSEPSFGATRPINAPNTILLPRVVLSRPKMSSRRRATQADWGPYENEILALYMAGMHLEGVMNRMKEERGFHATCVFLDSPVDLTTN